jgi:sarcosine oxidase, subunit beta
MAGVSAAFHLAVKRGQRNVVLVDERPPLTLTSDKGSEAYRNWWPDATMLCFMNRSIDLLEDLAERCGNDFELNRRGYVFLTADREEAARLQRAASDICARGAGPLRTHPGAEPYAPSPPSGFRDLPTGADLVLAPEAIRRRFPFVAADVAAMLHARRCGWLNAKRLGQWLLAQCRAHGVRLVRDRVAGVSIAGGRVRSVLLGSGDTIDTGRLVIAAGPYLKEAGRMLDLDLPVFTELHGKLAFEDRMGIVPSDAPLMIWNDAVSLEWSEAERRAMESGGSTRRLLEPLPAGVHFRPHGDAANPLLLIIWTYDSKPTEPEWLPTFGPRYADVLLRGLARMIPGLRMYFDRPVSGVVDGGYYCKTLENRPLIGPLPVEGAFVIGALSGYGIMGSQAAGELLAAHVMQDRLPRYAPEFLSNRYEDPAYLRRLQELEAMQGQL